MTQNERHKASVADLVIWAKDRLVDDLEEKTTELYNLINDFSDGKNVDPIPAGQAKNYAASSEKRRESFAFQAEKLSDESHKMALMLALPDCSYESLAALRRAGYWNGRGDTFFEEVDPPDGYAGQ